MSEAGSETDEEEAAALLADGLPTLARRTVLSKLRFAFGDVLERCGRDLCMLDGDSLLAYLLAEQSQYAAASGGSGAGNATVTDASSESASVLTTTTASTSNNPHALAPGSAALAAAVAASIAAAEAASDAVASDSAHNARAANDFQTLPLLFHAEQFLERLEGLGANFRVCFMDDMAKAWRGPARFMRQVLVSHLQHCTKFKVDVGAVVNPWDSSWQRYSDFHLFSYSMVRLQWVWPGSDALITPAAAFMAHANLLRFLRQRQNVVLLRGVGPGGRIDVCAAQFCAFMVKAVHDPAIRRHCRVKSCVQSALRKEALGNSNNNNDSSSSSLVTKPALPAFVDATLVAEGWRAWVAAAGVKRYLAASEASLSPQQVAVRVQLARLYMWHIVVSQYVPLEKRALPRRALPEAVANAAANAHVTELWGCLQWALAAASGTASTQPPAQGEPAFCCAMPLLLLWSIHSLVVVVVVAAQVEAP